MKKILWIVDGVGWGYDNLSNAIEKELPNYEHVMLAKKQLTRALPKETKGFVCESNEDFLKRINDENPDVIVSLNPQNITFLKNNDNVIIRFSGMRSLSGWRR